MGLGPQLRALPDERRAWGLTSHYSLWLLASNTFHSPWYVNFIAIAPTSYRVEYRMPANASPPWPNALVRGEARSEAQAVEMILVAMDRSEGWR